MIVINKTSGRRAIERGAMIWVSVVIDMLGRVNVLRGK